MEIALDAIPGLHEAVKNLLGHAATNAALELERTREALESLSDYPEAVTFEVFLRSLWANEGERNVTSRSRRGLRQAIKLAQAKFKKVNKRSDVQAEYFVSALIGRDRRPAENFPVNIPERFFAHLK